MAEQNHPQPSTLVQPSSLASAKHFGVKVIISYPSQSTSLPRLPSSPMKGLKEMKEREWSAMGVQQTQRARKGLTSARGMTSERDDDDDDDDEHLQESGVRLSLRREEKRAERREMMEWRTASESEAKEGALTWPSEKYV